MNGIIEDIYFGDLQPRVGSHDKNGKIKPYFAQYEKYEKALTESMTEEQKSLFRKYLNSQSEIEADLSVSNFIQGFKCGAKLFAEIFADSEYFKS